MHSVLVLLSRKPLESETSLQISNLALIILLNLGHRLMQKVVKGISIMIYFKPGGSF